MIPGKLLAVAMPAPGRPDGCAEAAVASHASRAKLVSTIAATILSARAINLATPRMALRGYW